MSKRISLLLSFLFFSSPFLFLFMSRVRSAMATLTTPAHVNTKLNGFSTGTLFSLAPNTARRTDNWRRVRCAAFSPKWRESRRVVSIALSLSNLFLFPSYGIAGSILDKYVKKKKLDPLEVYVPAVILTQFQIKDLEKTLEGDEPEYAACRSLLRSGPASSLRVNIRAVAQYASEEGSDKTAFDNVDQCLRALEELDSLLLRASRNERGASVDSMKTNIGIALHALDSLLQTVPSDVLEKGQAVADSYRIPEDGGLEILDPELKQLESLL